MAGTKLDNLTPKQKKAMGYVVTAWQRSGETTAVLEEGLRVLASDKRPPAYRISGDEQPYMAVACGYGKGYRDKLTLSKKDASIMLGLIVSLRQGANSESEAKERVAHAADAVIFGKPIPKTLADPSWEPVLRVLAEVAPSVGQRALF